ncbi:hypothetical protein TraAM80_07334 [Trypanosoma rangeli]|uniref:Uncharacterized protein n=1 Tax=Trypanosoma rangeli TaxID=5698 RepID=A0A3R7LPE9_TRYRA|nr:uncharacterized protein TraAM80_07334 [Trypanosoma rangeli]RNF00871.1 hypothetical protein TraAM80_07334 [Trypanosoma rangeli]|eukprot:RNF00871.1 hypothetical protein TraAM80_07334 [Trypanosoma rangeli]
MDFDLLDDAEEILHPLCLCLNQDFSRVGVGHHKGYVIYHIHRCATPAAAEREEGALCSGPPFYTTIEAMFPPRRESQCSTPTSWDVPERAPPSPSPSPAGGGETKEGPCEHQGEVDNDPLLDVLARSLSSRCHASKWSESRGKDVESGHLEAEKAWQPHKREEQQDSPGGTASSAGVMFEGSRATLTSAVPDADFARWMDQVRGVPLPTESGVGVMALLYKTRFVAVVGGGPYPVGPRNVVKIFIMGDIWADRNVCVPDPVEDLRLDHRLIIILTTRELRLHSFETGRCVFTVPLWVDQSPKSGPATSTSSPFVASAPLPAAKLQQLKLGGSAAAASSAPTTSTTRFVALLDIDYSKKCVAFRSSMVGFSLVRYDAESSLSNRVNAEFLATVPVAHEHALTSLAMDLNGELKSGGSSNAASGAVRWHIATCSERATLIRVWRYCEREAAARTLAHLAASTQSHPAEAGPKSVIDDQGGGSNLPGYFVKIREVRNASLPTPIFQMRFLGENFLFCIAWNTIKVFFVGEQEKPRAYDVSTKDPSKACRAQNCHSTLHHLGVVSAYFNSEWAACESPLPLTDGVFLPRWVSTASGELRHHLLRGIGSNCRMTDGDAAENDAHRGHATLEGSTSCSSLNHTQHSQGMSQNASVHAASSLSKSQEYGESFRRYVLQLAPIVESAGRAARFYWGHRGDNNEGATNREKEVTTTNSQERDYTMMTEIAQSLVVWWEQPAYWQVEYMTKAFLRVHTATTSEVFPSHSHYHHSTNLYCVTCDGSAVSFEFDPVTGTIECSKATAVGPRG